MNNKGSSNLMCGLPGSGKSHYLREYPGHAQIVICPDEFRLILIGQPFRQEAEEAVWSAVKTAARVFVGLQHKSIVIDAVHTRASARANWIRMARMYDASIQCTWLSTHVDICKMRNKDRKHPVPEEVIDRMAEEFEPPHTDEGFNDVLEVL